MLRSSSDMTDTLIGHFDRALKTLIPGSVTAARENPAATVESGELSEAKRRHSGGLMRINHTGEVCAQALYQGQSLTARLPEVRESMQEAADEEIDHLNWCEVRLQELGSRPSLLNPLWYGISYGLGALAGMAGDHWSLGFVAETERQVCHHLDEHMQKLPEQDRASQAILAQMRVDEAKHAKLAESAGAAKLPPFCSDAMTRMAELMKNVVYRI
jgi:ubiquinone biosynthesis monooxygenase Coq7